MSNQVETILRQRDEIFKLKNLLTETHSALLMCGVSSDAKSFNRWRLQILERNQKFFDDESNGTSNKPDSIT